jgi:ubiquinone/menaquinone biosynthesis C-methylase UbiE
LNKTSSPVLEVYDKHASTYDKRTSMMEKFFHDKVSKIFKLLHGEVLEVGVGTGNNLKNYNNSTNITALDWSPRMILYTKLKVKKLNLTNIRDFVVGDVQKLDEYFQASSFDFIVSRCVFCSVPNPVKGLNQIAKALKPNGKLIQIEHGKSNFTPLNWLMKAIDPFTLKAEGFHIKRDHLKNLDRAGFKLLKQWTLDPAGIFKVIIAQYKDD